MLMYSLRSNSRYFSLVFAILLLPAAQAPDEDLLYAALLKLDAATMPWAGEDYGEVYNKFSNLLMQTEPVAKRVLGSGPSARGRRLLAILGDYRLVHEFMKAYLNDEAVLLRTIRLYKPIYFIGRDIWPARLEKRFPGLIAALEEKDENGGYYIPGKEALDYALLQLHERLNSVA